jgi:hypothetical protein
MPRVNHVKKAQKDHGTCRCGKKLRKGQPYRWWKFRFGGKRVRCMDCKIRPSDLTNSKMGVIWDGQEDASESIVAWDPVHSDVSELGEIATQLAETVREVSEEYMEGVETQREYFPSGNPVMEENEERAQELESWACELEDLESDFEGFDEGEVTEEIVDELRAEAEGDLKDGAKLPDDWEANQEELEERIDTKRSEWADEQRDKIESVVSECPV